MISLPSLEMGDDVPKKGIGKKFGVGRVAPPELRDLPKPSEEAQNIGASRITYVAKTMFAKPKKNKNSRNNAPKPVAPVKAPEPVAPVEAPEPVAPVEAPEPVDATDDRELADMLDSADISGELKEMGKLIVEGETKDLYNTVVPTAYIPQTRRGFSEFIKTTYNPYELPEGPITIPEGEKYYPYQKFVKDYMRNESPYRGILVYHGLGSGKTCTAIAASEALFASAKKKIIVMTPFSLKRNFLKEISFCGFRHFQLNNFWIPLDPKDNTTTIFANQILGISGKYLKTAKNIWVPDFRKPQSESNYASLPDADRAEIRAQILSVVEWDPEKNPTGRIRFISYNGISAKKLMAMACEQTPNKYFDNAVIVIDEIHNLVRLMQGNIQAYLSKVGPGGKKVRRTVPVETVTHERWAPSLCKDNTKLYTRGYLFYRLLLDARNSKIVGLSGTPLVNFPEELGILSNVLHGYITTVTGMIPQSGKDVQEKATQIGLKNPYTDFVRAKQDRAGGGTSVLFSLLPSGIKKIDNDVGVERILEEDGVPTFEEIVESIKSDYIKAGIPFSGNLQAASEELLPPFGDSFRDNFMTGTAIKNKPILVTRLTGLVSFYKGSRLELMPRVKSDEVVRVPFSLYAQNAYSFKRAMEVKSEMEAAGGITIDKAFAKVYELGDSAGANNYKMGSRQACNFAFPSEVVRPSASAKELKEEAEAGEAVAALVTAPEEDEDVNDEFIQLEDETEDVEAVAKEDAEIAAEVYEGDAVTEERPPINRGKTAKIKTQVGVSSKEIKIGPDVENRFKILSNLAVTPVTITKEGKSETFSSVEHYYQSKKFEEKDAAWATQIKGAATPEEARAMAYSTLHKPDPDFKAWRVNYCMKPAVKEKVEQNNLTELLLSTGDKTLIQTEADRDNDYKSENTLGEILMALRDEIRLYSDMPSMDATNGGGKTVAQMKAERGKTAKISQSAVIAVDASQIKSVGVKTEEAVDCKRGTKPGEKYRDACARARSCLKTLAASKMTLGGVDGLSNYSAKYAAMLERIAAASGSSLVYSQFLDMEGIGIFRVAMEVNGYAPIEITMVGATVAFTKETVESLKRKQPRYMTFSGHEKPEVRRAALDIFNAKFSELPESMNKVLTEAGYTDNKVGELCRVFCITSAGAEGLSLRNVRAVHIMEPYWNEVRLRQVKGRAIRIGSHLDLPEDQRDVAIYTYISCFSEEAQKSRTGPNTILETLLEHDSVDSKKATELGLPIKPGMTNYVLTTDEMIYTISERKRKIIESLECILKTAAVDCELSIKQNGDRTFRCLPLKGKVGDFVYNPILADDILEGSKFEGSEEICSGIIKPREIFKKLNNKPYMLREILGKDGEVTGYEVFAAKEVDDPKEPGKKKTVKVTPEKKVGTAGVKKVDGVDNPGPPISITPQ
jgi:predicted NAD-dependent protein-ADP-ribosyltransferase YbiA (DUF1768 family)